MKIRIDKKIVFDESTSETNINWMVFVLFIKKDNARASINSEIGFKQIFSATVLYNVYIIYVGRRHSS